LKEKAFLGIDQGTSATKGVVLDEQGKILTHYRVEVGTKYHSTDHITQNPEELFQSVMRIIKQAEVDLKADYQIETIGLSCQRSGVCAFKSNSSKPLSDLLSWRDRSSMKIIESLSLEQKSLIQKNNSLPLIPDYAGAKIGMLQAKFKDSEVLIGTLDSYLLNRLTAGKYFCTEHGMAGHTLLYDFKMGKWSKALCSAFGVEIGRLPDIKPALFDYGVIPGSKTALSCILPDKQAALKGLIKKENQALLDLGSTFSFCVPLVSDISWQPGYFTSVLFSQEDKRELFIEGLLNYPGHILNTVIKKEFGFSEPEKISNLIEQIKNQHLGSAYFPIPSSSTPSWKYNQDCLVSNACLSDKRFFLKALIEHMACGMLDCILYLLEQKLINKKTKIKTTGGFSKIPYLLQFLSNLSGLEFTVLEESGGSAFGIATIISEKFSGLENQEWQDFSRVTPQEKGGELNLQKQIYQDWKVLRDCKDISQCQGVRVYKFSS
jgi:glycerol kinase